jgi:hypothetical protein
MNDDFHDIPDPTPHLPGIQLPWYLWAVAALVLLALIILITVLIRNRSKPSTSAFIEETYGNSRKLLEALLEQINDHPLSHLATQASFAVRGYLAACLSEPALYETHEEFLLREDALERLPAGSRDRLNPFLEELATLKYSPSTPDPAAAETLIKKSLNILQGLESTRAKPLPPNS